MATSDKGREFRFLRQIASGGFGSVYLAKVTNADGFSRLLAVKLLHRRWSDNKEIISRMRDEARLLGWLRHRNIVDVADLTSIDGRTAILMEYLEASDLKEVIQFARSKGIKIPVRVGLEVMSSASSALDAAFNRPPYAGEKPLRVIHRDIKPSNLMVDEVGLVKVLDFGVARAEFETRESHTRELQFGSVDYMPPERLMFEPESPASDIYSLGSTVFELICGEKLGKAKGGDARHSAFVTDRLSYLRAVASMPGSIASQVEDLLRNCLAFAEEMRPSAAMVSSTCRALARELSGISLAEWAEETIPQVRAVFEKTAEGTGSQMVGRTLHEDSSIFRKREEPKGADPMAPMTANDPRWDELRSAAQKELERLGPSSQGATAVLGASGPGDFEDDEFEEATRLADPEQIKKMRAKYREEMAEEAPKTPPAPAPTFGGGDDFDDEEDIATRRASPDEIRKMRERARAKATIATSTPAKPTPPPIDDFLDQPTEPAPALGGDLGSPLDTDGFGDDGDATALLPIPEKISEAPPQTTLPNPEDPWELPLNEVETRRRPAPAKQVTANTLLGAAQPLQAPGNGGGSSTFENLGTTPDLPEIDTDEGTHLLQDAGSYFDTTADQRPRLGDETAVLSEQDAREALSLSSSPPPMPMSSDVGAETILHTTSGSYTGSASTGIETGGGKKKFASVAIFAAVVLIGVGVGGSLFSDAIFGGGDEGGEVANVVEQPPAPEVEEPAAEPVEEPTGMGGPAAEAVEPPAAEIEEPPVAEVEAPVEAAPSGEMVTFSSAFEGTDRMKVRCGEQRGEGGALVEVAFAAGERCRVTAWAGEQKLSARFEPSGPGEYTCFEGGDRSCGR